MTQWLDKYEATRDRLEAGNAYDRSSERDACGVGLVCSIDGTPRRDVVEYAIRSLKAVAHRGAVDPEAGWHEQVLAAVDAYVAHIEARPAITLSWIRELPGLGAVAAPLHRVAMEHLTDMLVDLTGSPGFRRAGLPVVSRPIAVLLLGGLRELTAVLVEDGRDVREIVAPAVAASTALLGPAAR